MRASIGYEGGYWFEYKKGVETQRQAGKEEVL